jgi:Tripartite tricarboxylate transporter TctB family
MPSRNRDVYAGALMMLIGLGACFEGLTYKRGTLTHMGPGFFPVALGVILVVLGMLIAGSAVARRPTDGEATLFKKPQWRGWFCIIAGPVLFIILGRYGGMVPAAFACVFVSALGDRTATLKGSLILAAVVTVFAAVLFYYLLRIPFPLFRWELL